MLGSGSHLGADPVRQMLLQGAAECDVEELHPAADAEQGHSVGRRSGDQGELPRIPVRDCQRGSRLYRIGVTEHDVDGLGQVEGSGVLIPAKSLVADVVDGSTNGSSTNRTSALLVYQPGTWKVLRQIQLPGGNPLLAGSNSNETVCTAGSTGQVSTVDLATGEATPAARFSGASPTTLACPDGQPLLAGSSSTDAARSLTRRAGLASWFQQWAGIEEEAVSLYAYECCAIPGLLQPEPYIRAIFERRLPPLCEEQFERQVAARLERQRLLSERPHTSFSFAIEEALLLRGFGGPEVTRTLIDNLLEQGRRRNVEILIMPLRQEDHSGFEGPQYLAETKDNKWVGYVEAHDTSVLVTDSKSVSAMLQRYGKMRSQALSRTATVSLLKQMRGAL